jgi:hypothetical protein
MVALELRRATIAPVALSVGLAFAGCLPAPRGATSDASSASPSTAGSSPTAAAASSRPSPTAKAQTQAIAAFADRVASGKLTYRLSFKGHVSASADTLPIVGTMDVAGTDFASSFTYDFSQEYAGLGKERVEVRGVKGKGYIKRGSKGWQQIKGYGKSYSFDPFKTVTKPRDVRYVGAVKTSGATHHKIAITGALLLHPNTIPYDIQKETVDATELVVVIDDAGMPLSGTWTLAGKARIGGGIGQLQHVVYELDLAFSDVGAKITIRQP